MLLEVFSFTYHDRRGYIKRSNLLRQSPFKNFCSTLGPGSPLVRSRSLVRLVRLHVSNQCTVHSVISIFCQIISTFPTKSQCHPVLMHWTMATFYIITFPTFDECYITRAHYLPSSHRWCYSIFCMMDYRFCILLTNTPSQAL